MARKRFKNKIECPICGISVRIDNAENHLRRVHPGREVDFGDIEVPEAERKVKTTLRAGRWKKWISLLIIPVVIVTIFAFMPPPEKRPNYAPNFEIIDVYGQHHSLNLEIGETPILIEFFDPIDEISREMASVLTNLSTHFGSQLKMFSLSYRVNSEVKYFREYYGADWVFAHVTQDVLDDYGVVGYPHFVLVDKKGVIQWQFTGIIYLEDFIDVVQPWV